MENKNLRIFKRYNRIALLASGAMGILILVNIKAGILLFCFTYIFFMIVAYLGEYLIKPLLEWVNVK